MSEAGLYTPFEAPYRMAMGLMALSEPEWLEVDAGLADDLWEKRRLLAAQRDEVFRALPGSQAAQREVLDLLLGHLARHHAGTHRRNGRFLTLVPLGETVELDAAGPDALDLAGRLVQEDLCLLQRDEAVWRLTAASVCFPTRWALKAKMGRPLAAIHEPVPGYAERLGSPVDRFFDRLRTERPVWRLNWSLTDDAALFQPGGHGRTTANPALNADNAGDAVWLRTERQTLRRLPESGAILFTIRIHRHPLAALATRPEAARRLRQAIETMPPEMQRYKSIPALGEAVLGWLDQVIGREAAE